MPNRCANFILRVGTEAIEAYIRMESDSEVVPVESGTAAEAAANDLPTWEAAFKYILGRPRVTGTRPNPGDTTQQIENNFTVEWTAPDDWPTAGGAAPNPGTGPNPFDPRVPSQTKPDGTQAGPLNELPGTLEGTAPVFPANVSGTYDWRGEICMWQDDPN